MTNWLPIAAMPIGDHRNIMFDVRGAGYEARAFWNGKLWVDAIVTADLLREGIQGDAVPIRFRPEEYRIPEDVAAELLADAAPDLLAALKGAIGALEFSRDYHSDLSNAEQAFAQDKLDAATAAIAKAEGRA